MPCSHGCCPTQREHWLSVSFSSQATPTRRPRTVEIAARERRWERDHDAYRRLRRAGLQPDNLDGAARLEQRASSREEVTMGHVFPDPDQRKRVIRAMQEAKDLTDA